MKIAVAGAGGFIGGHLVKALLDQGHEVRAADVKPLRSWWQCHNGALNLSRHDLSTAMHAHNLLKGADWCYNLAEHMGGISFIEANKVECAESITIGIALLREAVRCGVQRFFFASSACVYPTHIQRRHLEGAATPIIALREQEAWPAQPEEGYGFSKLYMEELCRHYEETYGLGVRIARYHNIFGSPGSWNDGKEKSPAALCRKVAEAAPDRSIEIWGDGRQIRSYLHVSDCVRGTIALMESDYGAPLNIGSNRAVTVNQLVSMIEDTAGTSLKRTYNMKAAQGVGVRNADISLAMDVLGWKPEVPLEEGLAELYRWISEQVKISASGAGSGPPPPTTEGFAGPMRGH